MINQFTCVGRLINEPIKITNEEGRKYTEIRLAIPRSYKNEYGEYDTDFISIKLFNYIAESTLEYCRKGDLIGVKGRVEENDNRLEIIAEKISFLSSSNNNNN